MKLRIEWYVSEHFLEKILDKKIQNTIFEKFKTRFSMPKSNFFTE
jgi:hypothetical protein